jgi:hypothetical protein
MESNWISTIQDWLTPESVRDVQVRLRFTNFYLRVIRKYAKVTLPLTELLKTQDRTGRPPKDKPRHKKSEIHWKAKSTWTWEAELAFEILKQVSTKVLILQHFDPAKPIVLQTDVSGFAIAGILNQYDNFCVLRPVHFYHWQCSSAKKNYDTYDRELLTIVETLKQWRHYLVGANQTISIQCDHKNLNYFQTSKVLSRKEAR